MQNEPNQQPTPEPEHPSSIEPEQPAPVQPEISSQPQAEVAVHQAPSQATDTQVPVTPAPLQSPAQPVPNSGQPANLSAQKLLDDYENDRDRHDVGKIMVIGCIFMLLGGISLAPVATWLFAVGPAIFVILLGAPAYLGSLVVAITTVLVGFLLVFRKEFGRIGARIVAVLQLILIAINFFGQLAAITFASGLSISSDIADSYATLIALTILSVIFYVWVFKFMGKQSVRNLFRA